MADLSQFSQKNLTPPESGSESSQMGGSQCESPHLCLWVLTLFPEYFSGPLQSSLLGKAVANGSVQVNLVPMRPFGKGAYKAVDDRPYGGSEGMVMTAPALERAFAHTLGLLSNKQGQETDKNELPAEWESSEYRQSQGVKLIYLSPQGAVLTAQKARTLVDWGRAPARHLILLCGHYEGIDDRFIECFVDEEISVGDYVLTGGEPAAVVVLDALSRFVPQVVGQQASVDHDTFETNSDDTYAGGLKYPVFTRPAQWRGRAVPEVLSSGNHAQVKQWRKHQSYLTTLKKRPDLIIKQREESPPKNGQK